MSSREATLKLIAKRDSMEREIDRISLQLASLNVAPNESLITSDGFPRHDVDVHAIRNLRVQQIRLQNDLKHLLNEIALNLQHAFPDKPTNKGTNGESAPGGRLPRSVENSTHMEVDDAKDSTHSSGPVDISRPRPFATVASVLSGSLGWDAGLEAGDNILVFGEARDFSQLAEEFRRAQGGVLRIKVSRGSEVKEFSIHLTQDRTLGAHLVPYERH